MPRLTTLLRHAFPRFVEGVLAPVAVFYAALVVLGFHGALIAAVGWVYLGVLWRVVRRRPIPGTLLLAAVGVTARAAVSAATGSLVLYFLQPTFGTLLISIVFLASVPLGKPFAQKLAVDMVPLPDAFLAHERVRQFFLRISLLWSMVLLANVAITLWLLLSQSIGVFLWVRTGVVAGLGAAAIGVSILSFRRVLRRVNTEHSAHGALPGRALAQPAAAQPVAPS
ncbi:MAG TPA: VC0807 family protein [Streptosporangiaceae bacterium]